MPRNEKSLVQIALLTQFFTALPKTWNPDSGYLIRHYNFWSLFSLLSTKYSFEKRNLKINSILNLSINYFYFHFFISPENLLRCTFFSLFLSLQFLCFVRFNFLDFANSYQCPSTQFDKRGSCTYKVKSLLTIAEFVFNKKFQQFALKAIFLSILCCYFIFSLINTLVPSMFKIVG